LENQLEIIMQNKTKIALAAGALTLVAAGGLAGLANADRGGWGGGHRNMMTQMTARYDANKDGKLDQAEIDQNRTAWHTEFDGDKNGTLSLEEFKGLWMKANLERVVREFQEFDRDGNAQVTLDEYKAPMARMIAQMDQNNDGVLSADDHQAMHGNHRHRMHGNGMGPDDEGDDNQ
jgi:Ca2+-binding EF-hand superfamily protein